MRAVRLMTFLKTAGRDGLVLLHALRDGGTPRALKAAIIGLALYTLSPIDLLPDLAPMLGWADDLALLMLAIPVLVRKLPAEVRERAERRAGRMRAR
ncbi:MAG TPA: DUF1232 domain-containing protein [Burkholderiaceae bacterium]|nr:DUF1232 domain-containing protein [Burkholderiaceae bacterium]